MGGQTFYKGSEVNISGSMGPMGSRQNYSALHCSMETAIDNWEMNERGCFPRKLY